MPISLTHIIIALFLLFTTVGLAAQCPDQITLSNQSEVDNFSINYTDCFEFDGHLIIKGANINNIDGITFLTSMTGILEIIETSITSIESLSSISTINGSLFISDNNNLESLRGLEHVINMDSLVLHSNPLIENFDGLNNLEFAKYISFNNLGVTDFSGLENLEESQTLRINNNSSVTSLEGLGKLRYTTELALISNAALASVEGLDELSPDSTTIRIHGSPELVNFEGFEHLEKLFILDLDFNTGLESFDGLENVVEIDRLNVNNCNSLSDLSGLRNVVTFTSDLSLRRCGLIDDFSALESLELIGRNLLLTELGSLISLDDFNDVKIGFDISIEGHANLVDVTGFANLKQIAGELTLNTCPELLSISGFIDMTTNGGLIVSRLVRLKDLTGLANLQFINGKLEIFENSALENLDDLVSLTYVNGIEDDNPLSQKDVQIEDNPELTSILGLNDLLYADDKIFIRNNEKLTICDVESICRFINDPNIEITIEGNGFPCGSVEEIRSDCNSAITDTDYNSCELVSSVTISNEESNTNGLIDIFDGDGKVICAINANGSELGKTDIFLYVSSNDRYDDFNRPILRRNLSIETEFEPQTPISIRIYFKDFEFERLKFLDPSISDISDLRITELDSICSGSFDGSALPSVESTSSGTYLSPIDYYIEADFSQLANFFVHGPNELGIDNDGDGFDSIVDCDESDPAINPAAIEILDNDIDENCDGILGITDDDGDGYGIAVDCNDDNPAINPGATEILDNEFDEDCDGIVNLSDTDGDGYDVDEDCDDNDPTVNPGAIEIIDNDIDENCDDIIEITDIDGDGYGIAVDCDDLNAAINPGAMEIPDNDIDENCDEILGETDADDDGFPLSVDCNDDNPTVYPGAPEIPDNGIDEDCDGIDPSPVVDINGIKVEIYPNPVFEYFVISANENIELEIQLIDLQGKVHLEQVVHTHEDISVEHLTAGTYFLKMSNQTSTQSTLLFIAR